MEYTAPCIHLRTTEDNGCVFCIDCGLVFEDGIVPKILQVPTNCSVCEKEFRYGDIYHTVSHDEVCCKQNLKK